MFFGIYKEMFLAIYSDIIFVLKKKCMILNQFSNLLISLFIFSPGPCKEQMGHSISADEIK